jgi:C4-dicarboxylate-specific signal transduction histidine kinase
MITRARDLKFDADRVSDLLERLERLIAHDRDTKLAISPAHDELDAIAFGINALAEELRWAHARISASERARVATAARLRDELAHLDRVTMLDALTASLAHEINQPLTAVATNADAALLLLATDPPRWGDVAGALTDIRRDSHRAVDIVHRMRGLIKKRPAQHQPVDLGASVAEVVTLAENHAAVRRIGLDVDLPAAGLMVLGDRIEIQQVVLNLLLNAFDAVQALPTPERRVRLDVSRHEGRAVLEVRDGGPGLPVEQMARLFEPFYTTKQEGLGLGLPICRAIVGAHDGTIEVRRNAGTGMTFSVAFPILMPGDPGDDDVPATPRPQR